MTREFSVLVKYPNAAVVLWREVGGAYWEVYTDVDSMSVGYEVADAMNKASNPPTPREPDARDGLDSTPLGQTRVLHEP